jgi:excisionase family DNA binding protein
LELTRRDLELIVARVAEGLAGRPDAAAGPGEATRAGGKHPEVMTVEQLADYLQLHPQVLYRHIRQGNIPVSRIGKTLRFKRSVIDAWLESAAWRSIGAEPSGGTA